MINETTTGRIGQFAATLLTAGALMLTLAAGTAFALNQINCASFGQNPLTPQCYGTDQDDEIQGRGAEDAIFARGGNDTVYGGAGGDSVAGGNDDDGLFGGKNADVLVDDLNTVPDQDELRGGGGNDRLDAFDGDYDDIMVCGPGDNDKAVFDFRLFPTAADTVSDTCETKVRGLMVDPR